ncbi:MAG: RAMP superfamily CRISPR-associated protein [Methylobacter sp.]|jgi:CRISPR/Cas system CSM-associated protein Csm3 (group 7 of RAMP superfamily)|nr:RAMP superfamily CRISPR-associated protein [Methylobacter sp.]
MTKENTGMQKTILHILLTLRGPLLTQSSSPGQLGLDVVIARNHKNQPYIPGTLVSGKIRQAMEELQNAIENENKPDWFGPELNNWLGQASENEVAKTKRLFFSDFVLNGDDPSTLTRYRIKIDSKRGSVDKHQLAMIESPFVSGEHYSFSGQVHFFSSRATSEKINLHLKAAIKWLSHLGALRAIGFGQVEQADVTDIEMHAILTPKPTETLPSNRIGLCIQPAYPFCLPGKSGITNLFESESIIPGAAIKGCIATTWNHLLDRQSGRINNDDIDRIELRQNFSKLRISHAFPSHIINKRSVVAPLSLVKTAKESHCYDVARLNGPCLIDGLAPDFAVDWKDTKETLKDYPWPYLRFKDWGWDSMESELRIRTAIDREQLRSAENDLFAYEQIIPDNKRWYSELDLSQIDQQSRGEVLEQLKTLCGQGLIGLGKTKTPLQIHFTDTIQPVVANKPKPIDNNLWLITLQTDTLLGSPETLDEAGGVKELCTMYQQAWHEISAGKLKLLRYFARQRLSGGRHRQKLMQNRGNSYRPWLLTEAGSVFVLQGKEDITDLIALWLYQGLPITEAAVQWYRLGDNPSQYWQYTPFVPENGYGEIAVNLQADNVIQLTDADKIEYIKNGVDR